MFVVAEPLSAVGGILEIPAGESGSPAGSASGSPAGPSAYYIALPAAAATIAVLTGAWYARRRWGR